MYWLYLETLLNSLTYNAMHFAAICFLLVGMLPVWRGIVQRRPDRDMYRAFVFLVVCLLLMLISINAIETAKAVVWRFR